MLSRLQAVIMRVFVACRGLFFPWAVTSLYAKIFLLPQVNYLQPHLFSRSTWGGKEMMIDKVNMYIEYKHKKQFSIIQGGLKIGWGSKVRYNSAAKNQPSARQCLIDINLEMRSRGKAYCVRAK